MENTNNTSEESVHPERGTEQAVEEDVADGEDTSVVTVDPNGGTELEVNEDNVEGSLTAVKADTDPREGGSKSTDSKDGKTQPGEGTPAEGGTSSKDKERGDSEVGTGSKFLRLPIFAGSSSVELDDKVELPEDPPEVPFQEDDGLGDSLWTIQKRQGQIELEHSEESNPDGGRAASEEQRNNEESDLMKNDDGEIEKSVSSDREGENKYKVKLDQTSKSDKHRTPGKGKESKSRNYRSNQTLFTSHKSKKTDLYSDIDDSIAVPTSSAVFEKNSQGVSEKSKKHSEKTASSKVKVGDKSICSDMFDDRTQDSVSDLGKLEDLDDFKLEKSPKPGDLPTYSNPLVEDVKFEYEDSNDSVPSTSWSDAGIGSAIITQEQYSDKKWRMDKVQSMDQELNSKPSSHKSPRGSRRRSDSKGKEQDPGLLITVAGGSEDRSVAEKREKNTEIYEQQKFRKNESDKESSKDRREKSSSKSRSYHREDDSDHNKFKSRKHRSRSRSKERRRRSRSRERRERSRSREKQDGSRSQQKSSKSKDKRERSRSIEHKSRERRERSRSWERKEGSKSTEKRQRSRSRERRKSKRDRSRSVERRRERSRSSERRHDRSRSVERKHDQHKQEQTRSAERRRDHSRSVERRQSTDERHSRSMERSSKKNRREKSSEKRKSRDLNSSPHRQEIEERLEQEEKLDVFSYGIKRLHDGKNKKKKKLRTTETEPIVILSDDELDSTPKMKSDRSSLKQKTNSDERDLNRIEPIITARSSSNHRTKDKSEAREPPLPTEEVIQPPMPPAISNVIKVLTDSKEPKRSKSRHKEVEEDIFSREEAKTKESERHRSFDEEMEDRSFEQECAYDPAFPTVDMEESPTEDQPIVLEEAAEPIQMTVNPLLHKELPMQSISPLPGPPPPPMPGQGLLGEPSILLPASAGEPSQSMLPGAGQQIPLQLRMLAPGFAAQQPGGLPPQRQLIMNHPVFINRPGSFPHLQQLPPGHPLQPRLVSTPGGMVTMQNQFPHRIPSLVSVPGQHGLLNGALDHLSHDPHLILTSDPHGDPRLHHPHPPHPHPEHRVISIRPEVPVVPMSVHDNMPLSIASSEALSMNQPNIIPSVSQLEQISQITKLLNTQAQLAMFGKESKGLEHHEHKQEPMEQKNSNNVFKVPLPPILTHTLNKVKSEKENMEMVDMDMSSPQDNGNIEIPTSSSEKSERSRRRDKKKSHRHRQDRHRTSHEDRHRSSHEDSVTSTVEKTYDQIMEEMNSVDEIPSSAVELTNKEKYLRKLHLQERVVDEVKTALKPFYSAKKVNKEQYKEILRRAVPKVCHSKSGDINPVKIRALVDAYVAKFNRNMSPPKDENEDQPKKAQ